MLGGFGSSHAGPYQLHGHGVLTYVAEHMSRSKTPIVDALLVLYPAFAAVLTLHQVQLFCAQELCELSDKDAPLRVHYLYKRWHNRGRHMLNRRAEDAELDKSGVPSCALWVHALCGTKCKLQLSHAWRRADRHGHAQHRVRCNGCITTSGVHLQLHTTLACHACGG
jgi:hypothetical protein